ncbi:hypothetical protein TSUD_160070 [Trifolium subterraneum]|uniref:Uncharacterized protein n=1 Tax=Trifolium subterraneum TaxID=3900 RepID=A0A2Z6MSA5_TRISU|nr:hypothetical protein TSUD_160070 [Trifolium subterraneum]
MDEKSCNSSRIPKKTFITMISKDRVEGELEPRFARKYAKELKSCLKIVDNVNEVQHVVGYNMVEMNFFFIR